MRYFTEFTSHLELIDFDHHVFDDVAPIPKTDEDFVNAQKAADYISHIILGLHKPEDFYYLDLPEFKHLTTLETELKILKDHGRDNYATRTKYNRLPYQHGLMALRLMFPQTDITPPLADITYLSFGMFQYQRKALHLLGSMDAGKSSTTARLAHLFLAIDPDNSFVISATPLLESAMMTVFGDIIRLASELHEAHPPPNDNPVGNRLFPDMRLSSSSSRIELRPNTLSKGAFMAHRSLKREGMALGSKGSSKDKRLGIGLFIADECNKIENIEAFKRDMVNVARQEWFQLHTTQNPVDPTDSGGLLAHPKPWVSNDSTWGWSSYDEIRQHEPLIWPTELSGIAYRLDAHKSVNQILQKVVYDYYVKQSKIDQVATDYGTDSPQWHSQVRAMFPSSSEFNTLFSESNRASSRHQEQDYTVVRHIANILAVDPAETGLKDKAVIVTLSIVEAVIQYIDGSRDYKQLLTSDHPIDYVTFDPNQYWRPSNTNTNTTLFDLYLSLGLPAKQLTLGAPIPYEQQIALRTLQLARERNVPLDNIVYDPSMRAEITEAMVMMMGQGPVAIPLRDKPRGFQLRASNQNTLNIARNVNSEALFLAADVIKSKSLRDNGFLHTALIQLQRRRLVHHPTYGLQPEPKEDFKQRNQGKSPDEGDAFSYGVWFARQRGFTVDSPHFNSESKPHRSVFRAKRETTKRLQSIPDLL